MTYRYRSEQSPVCLTISPPDCVQLFLDSFMSLPTFYERLNALKVIIFARFKPFAIMQYKTLIRFGVQWYLDIRLPPFVVFRALSGCISSSQRWIIAHSTASSIPKVLLINEVFPTPTYTSIGLVRINQDREIRVHPPFRLSGYEN